MHEITFRAMGCQMAAVIDADTPAAVAALAQVPEWFEGWEQALSRFRTDSELNQLNDRPAVDVPVSPALWDVVDLAFEAWHTSGGLVTPTQLTALVAAGYDPTFDALTARREETAGGEWNSRRDGAGNASRAGRPPANGIGAEVAQGGTAAAEPAWPAPRPAPDLAQSVSRHGQALSLRLAGGVRLDLGGVAKGWAADETVARLSAFGPALMDAGGDIAVSGPRQDSAPWVVGVANPFFPDDALDNLLLSGRGGVATSGRDYRRWQRNGRWYHHILDPRTGRPAETDVLTATVIAPSAARAEVAAKVALILGSQAGRTWLAARPELAGCLVLDDGRQIRTESFAAYTTVTA